MEERQERQKKARPWRPGFVLRLRRLERADVPTGPGRATEVRGRREGLRRSRADGGGAGRRLRLGKVPWSRAHEAELRQVDQLRIHELAVRVPTGDRGLPVGERVARRP